MKTLVATAATLACLLSACSTTGPRSTQPVALNVSATPRVSPTAAPSTAPSTQPSGLGLAGYKVQEKWDKAVAMFETIATTRPSKVGGTVFIGSSSFTKWKTLEKDLAQFDAVNRGFGGSKSDDMLYYGRRILEPLKPTRIVYYCGSNDLAAKRTPEVVVANFKAFVELARQIAPGVKVYFIAENDGPKRAPFSAAFAKVNDVVRRWTAEAKDVYFIDAREGLFNADGTPRAELFLKDGVHLNDDGYKIWGAHIKAALSKPTGSSVSTR